MATPLEQWFLNILVCPDTKAPVVQNGDWLYSTDADSRRRYPIENGIPKMLVEESEVVSEQEFADIMARHKH